MGRKRTRLGLTDECLTLSVVSLARDGVFKEGPGNDWRITWKNDKGEKTSSIGYSVRLDIQGQLVLQLKYDLIDPSSGARLSTECPVKITTTPGNFGGLCYWFVCPLVTDGRPCKRRVGRLYLSAGGRYFGCRTCYKLTYRCQRYHNKRMDALMKLPIDEFLYHWNEAQSTANVASRRLEKLFKKLDTGQHDKRWDELMNQSIDEIPHSNEAIYASIAAFHRFEKLSKKRRKRQQDRRRDMLEMWCINEFLKEMESTGHTRSLNSKSLAYRVALNFKDLYLFKK